MSDSDADSDYDCEEISQHIGFNLKDFQNTAVITIQPSDEVYEKWTQIPIEVKQEANRLMRLSAFWIPILLRQDNFGIVVRWAADIHIIDPHDRDHMSLKHLRRIEILEAIFRALERGSMKTAHSKQLFWISKKLNLRSPEVFEDALQFLERTGEPNIRSRVMDLGHQNVRFVVLHLIFTEFAQYLWEMGAKIEKTMTELKAQTSEGDKKRSEEMKRKGNDYFQNNQFEDALKFYSKAIKCFPENHKLYGNRALCLIKCNKYIQAVGDGKRATMIKPSWAKGHYRFCEALFLLGRVEMAIEKNAVARRLCKDNQEGLRELEHQHRKFTGTEEPRDEQIQINDSPDTTDGADPPESPPPPLVKGYTKVTLPPPTPGKPQSIFCGLVVNMPSESAKKQNPPAPKAEVSTKVSKPSKPPKSESAKNEKGDSNPAPKKKSKSKSVPSEEEKGTDSKSDACEEKKSSVEDAPTDARKEKKSSVQDAPTDARKEKKSSVQDAPTDARKEKKSSVQDAHTDARKEKKSSVQDAHTDARKEKKSSVQDAHTDARKEKKSSVQDAPTDAFKEKKSSVQDAHTDARKEKKSSVQDAHTDALKEKRSSVQDAPTDARKEKKSSVQDAPTDALKEKRSSVQDAPTDARKEKRSSVQDAPTDARKEMRSSVQDAHTDGCKEKRPLVQDAHTGACKEMRSLVQDAHTALTDLRNRNAEQAFSQALALLDTSTPKDFGLSTVDVLLLLYGHASALTEIGQPEELSQAQRLLEKIKSFEERRSLCLVYYAVGKVYVKENRFAVALKQFSDSLQMVKNQITPGILTWPLTTEIVKETQPDHFKDILESAIELCKFPPIPDAICRHEKCHSHFKTEIYFTDPDFKGFIQIHCCQSCIIEYHISCWKSLKTSTFFEKNEKDFLQEACLTPDCVGKICNIKIYGPTGLVKCKFEADITKPQTPKKPKVNQKCTSLKKLKSKEERRLKRKQHKQSFQDMQTINDEILLQEEDSETQSQQKAWLLYRDRALLQINQNLELLREEKGLPVSSLTSSLKPWLELDSMRGNEIAGRILNCQQEKLETLGQIVELLLERKNRVWARVLIHLLSDCLETNPKLNNWACQLNDAGLNAAKSFIDRNADHLEQLDLALLLNFGPLQELIIEKLGTRPELFSSIGLTVTEYLKQATPHDMRLFIWTLEEHRDMYESCHTILDEYFDMMDGHCSVLKKSDENENNSLMKAKSRGRKKKQKEPKGVIVLSGMRGLTPRDDRDQDIFEEDSLSFLHPVDPFSVPSYLREQVDNFEELYNSTRHQNHFKKILDNNPDQTKETLYDYFAQILEEHGPLVAEDPLLVGEVENFPSVAQLKIQETGSFENFLLESLRFIKIGRCIGLAKHAVSLQQAEHGSSLDDLDDLGDPDTNSSPADLLAACDPEITNYLNNYSSAETEVYPVLPNPYAFSSAFDPLSVWTNSKDLDSQQHGVYLPNVYKMLYPHGSEVDVGVWETDSSSGGIAPVMCEERFLKKDEAVQTCPETMRSVAVNTEPHEPFEKCHGDIHKKEKSNKELKEKINEMTNGSNKVNLRHKEEINSIEEETRMINVNIQVTNKELSLLQQKLEEEVKKDQKEKKANQEVLKSIKLVIEKLVEEQGSLTQNIKAKKTSYEAKRSNFSELSNQIAAEKMSLMDEIKRRRVLFKSASKRSRTAQLLIMESSRDQGLYGLYRELADGKALLTKLDEMVHRFPSQELESTRKSCRGNVQDVEKKITTAETQYKEHMEKVKNGIKPHSVNNTKQPVPSVKPLLVAAKEITPPSSAAASNRSSPLIQQSAPAAAAAEAPAAPPQKQHKHPTRTPEPPHSTVFDKAMERLSTMFPDYTRSDLMKFAQELRSSSGGSLNSMTLEGVVGGVTQLILDHQEKLISARSNAMGRGSPAHRATPPLVNQPPVWQQLGHHKVTHFNALNVEDPCIICHDDMSPDDMCVLECRHSFHKECIKSWLKEQSTCPTCRDHTLLPDDFPVLPGRRRQAP